MSKPEDKYIAMAIVVIALSAFGSLTVWNVMNVRLQEKAFELGYCQIIAPGSGWKLWVKCTNE